MRPLLPRPFFQEHHRPAPQHGYHVCNGIKVGNVTVYRPCILQPHFISDQVNVSHPSLSYHKDATLMAIFKAYRPNLSVTSQNPCPMAKNSLWDLEDPMRMMLTQWTR